MKQFSKILLLMESALVLFTTVSGVCLARLAIISGYTGALPWITTMVTACWGAYGASAGCYYNKAKAENTKGGIVYDAAARDWSETV